MPASVFGVLARLGLTALATYDGRSVFPLAYAQAVGCLVMGIALRIKQPLGQYYSPLYTALTTGFCGSLTTFSGWQLDIFNAWLNAANNRRAGLRDALDGIGQTVFTLSISMAALQFGLYISFLVLPSFSREKMIPRPRRLVRYCIVLIAVLIYAGTYPTYFLMSPHFRHQATAAILFSFPGTLTRYLLSIHLNLRIQAFPLGTFAANTLGTALLGAFHVLQNLSANPLSPNACNVLQGLIDGYCGCLTTVSTFAAELYEMGGWSGLRYGFISWGVSQLLLLVILGPSFWAGHIPEHKSCVFM
ncbi:hypothetical protein AMATHDRAFT_139084 [Amanita thiersii Skay4041]|uniref:Fluoride ion transporter CrcB n=1 Tax=Amanita thiersii Skay4041 TaxID=703135 RepID=A0A2A9NY93_9AGAR|nr:hypothetical protein AMATHDRAFT_139084 [Amanita thiersii Skay4041]